MSQSYSLKEPAPADSIVAPDQAVLSSLANMITIWLNRHQGRRDLSELDDRLLADVGISRVDAVREAGKPFWRTEKALRRAGAPRWRA